MVATGTLSEAPRARGALLLVDGERVESHRTLKMRGDVMMR